MDINSNNENIVINQNNNDKKENIPFKNRLTLSALAGFLISFTVCIYGVLDIYINNSEQFSFYLGDFLGHLFLYGFLFFAFITLFISIFRGKVFYVVIALFFWIAVMLYIQGNFLNIGLTSLMGDDLQEKPNITYVVINIIVWGATGVATVLFALLFKNRRLLFNISAIVMITIIGMQLVSCAVQLAPKAFNDGIHSNTQDETSLSDDETETTTDTETDEQPTEKKSTILTTKGLFEVSNKRNIIIFIFDRFDATYYNELIANDPDFLAPLDGFTYYSDFTSLYCRTYPAVTSMITGKINDFSGTAEDYFNTAYGQSDFLSDLQKNDYKIKLYTTSYYAYRENTKLSDIADNEFSSRNYKVKDTDLLTFKMIGLSAYRYFPNALKDTINITTSSFSGHVEHSSDYPRYEKNDAKVYQDLVDSGLTVQSDDSNNYIFIHLNGCHPPYLIDENGNTPGEDGSSKLSALKGCFKLAYEYIDNLKALGLYDDSTIIITGDHAAARSDTKDVYNPRITSMFVKYSGESGTELKYSDVPVSQDSLIATIIESEGILTEHDYGKSFREFKESDKDIIERRYFFQRTSVPSGNDEIIEYKITGSGWDFDNWEVVNRTNIGRIYK